MSVAPAIATTNGPALVAVRTRRDWASDPDHASAFPSHIRECAYCFAPFDRDVDEATGLHHESQHAPAKYCRALCGRRAKAKREKRRASLPAEPTNTELLRILNSVRTTLARQGQYWQALYHREWVVLQLGAPEVAALLRFYEDRYAAQKHASAAVKRLGQAQSEIMRKRVVEVIDDWHRSNALKEAVR